MALRRQHYVEAEQLIEKAKKASPGRAQLILAFANVHASLASAPLEVALDAGNPE